jgi:hypothetical protein
MPLKNENHFSCDLKKPNGDPDCNVDFYYDPGGPGKPVPQWDPGIQNALNKAIAITHPLTQFTTFWCCDEHAQEGIARGQHLPPLPSKVQGATEADMNNAKRGMSIVDKLRSGAVQDAPKPS